MRAFIRSCVGEPLKRNVGFFLTDLKRRTDTASHTNKMDALVSYSPKIGGLAPYVYLVRVCSFTFEFHRLSKSIVHDILKKIIKFSR